MRTAIWSNGSKWAGEEPDSLAVLEKMLKRHTLDPCFEGFGNFAYQAKGIYRLLGNFRAVSHVFYIETTSKKLFRKFKRLIRINQKKEDYKK